MGEPRTPSPWNRDLFRPEDWRSPADYRRRQLLIIIGGALGAFLLLAIASALLAHRAGNEADGSTLLRQAPHKLRAPSERERIMGAPGKRGARVSRQEKRRQQQDEELP